MTAAESRDRGAAAAAARDVPHPAGAGGRRPPRLRDPAGGRARAPAASCGSAPARSTARSSACSRTGLIVELRERPAPEQDDERRRYYRITPLGSAVARAEAARLSALVRHGARRGPGAGAGVMRAYDALLRLLPASFRSEYGDEMRAIFARRRRDARGPLAPLALWARRRAATSSPAPLRVHLDILRQDLRYVGRSLRPRAGLRAHRRRGGGARRRRDHGGVLDHRPRADPAAALPRRRIAWCSSGRTRRGSGLRASSCRPPTSATGSA